MSKPEMIIVKFVAENVYADTRKPVTKYIVQFAGYSDKPSKLMKLQVWDMPFDSSTEARKTLENYQEKMKAGSFMIINNLK